MKKLFFPCLIGLLLNSNIASAQFIKGFGFKFGMTKASQNWDYTSTDVIKPDSRTGMNIGVFAESFGLLGLSAVGEMNYSQKGMTDELLITAETGPEIVGTQTVNNRFDYLSFALLAKYNFNFVLFKPYIFGGPRADFEITRNIHPGYSLVYDDFDKSIMGWTVGMGVETGLLPVVLLAEVRYNADKDFAFKNENLSVKNNTIELRAGIRF